MTPALYAQDWIAHAKLEELVTSAHFFGLTTASPVQRAFCRIIDGEQLGTLGADPVVLRALGGALPPASPPREMAWLSAIRVAKSLAAAALAVRLTQRCNLDQLGPGEVARIPIISLDKDKAQAVLNHLIGRVMASPLLKMLVLDEPTDGLVLRSPSGRPVLVCVVAGKRAGGAVMAYWLAGAIFDEYPRMSGADDAVVNWDETRASAQGRVLPGGAILNIGSPWAPEGPAYNQVTTHFGKPTADLVVMRSTGPETNPSWWTPERVADDARTNPNHRTDCLAEFATPEEALFSSELVTSSTRRDGPEQLPYVAGGDYAAAMDPATRGNGWTLVLATREGERLRVALALEWIGTRDKPLDPGVVLDEIKAALAPYKVTRIDTDQHMGDALARLGSDRGLTLVQWPLVDAERTRRYLALRTRFAMGHVELPAVEHLRSDLVRVKKRITTTGVTIALPQTSDGRHCDFAPAIMLAMSHYLDDVRTPVKASDTETARMREQTLKRYGRPTDEDEDD